VVEGSPDKPAAKEKQAMMRRAQKQFIVKKKLNADIPEENLTTHSSPKTTTTATTANLHSPNFKAGDGEADDQD